MKHPHSQKIFARLVEKSGFVKEDGRCNRKAFCKFVGMRPNAYKRYIDGNSALSLRKITELCNKLGLKEIDVFEE